MLEETKLPPRKQDPDEGVDSSKLTDCQWSTNVRKAQGRWGEHPGRPANVTVALLCEKVRRISFIPGNADPKKKKKTQ